MQDYAASWVTAVKNGLLESSPQEEFSFAAALLGDSDDSINFHEFVNTPAG